MSKTHYILHACFQHVKIIFTDDIAEGGMHQIIILLAKDKKLTNITISPNYGLWMNWWICITYCLNDNVNICRTSAVDLIYESFLNVFYISRLLSLFSISDDERKITHLCCHQRKRYKMHKVYFARFINHIILIILSDTYRVKSHETFYRQIFF